MADRMRISRRRVMQIGILAPLAAMRGSGASAEEKASAAVSLAGIPSDVLDDLVRRARDRATAKGYTFDESQFRLVAGLLWASFTRGVTDNGKMLPTDPEKLRKLLENAYDQTTQVSGMGAQKSGDLIADCATLWTDAFDSNAPKHEPVTQYCAYLCGMNAAVLAGNGDIDEKIYSSAFQVTKRVMSAKLNKARCLPQGSYPSGDDVRSRGAGC